MKTKILMMLLAGITLLAACKGSGSISATDSAKKDSAALDSVKLVKTAEMHLKVKNVQTAAEKISRLTELCDGMVVHHNMRANVVNTQDIELNNDSLKKLTVYNSTADLVLKIPSGIVEPFMDSLNHLGIFVDNRTMNVEDRTLDYLSEKLKAQNREQAVKLQGHIKLTTRIVDSMLTLKDDVVDRKISNLRTDDAVKYSVINLSLYQSNTVTKEVVANDNLSGYNISLMQRMGLAIAAGWYYFSELLVGLMNLWPFLLLGLLAWIWIWYFHRKKQNKLQQPA